MWAIVPVVLNIVSGVFPAAGAGSDFFMQLIAVDACVCVLSNRYNFVKSYNILL